MAWLPDGKKIENMFIRFHTTHDRDRQTDGQTEGQTPHADTAALMYRIARQKLRRATCQRSLVLFIMYRP